MSELKDKFNKMKGKRNQAGSPPYYVNDLLEDMINNINLTNVTYKELVDLRNNNELIPGQQYRIIDYVATTIDPESRSANHTFDIIVIADSINILNNKARAIQHENDTYFNQCNLAAWQIWYSLDNDVNKWTWADINNGKGVIYRMIDEFNNDVGYDFKGIQFKRVKITGYSDFEGDSAIGLNDDETLIKCIGHYTHKSTKDCWFTINESDYEWFYLFSLYTDGVIIDTSVNSIHTDIINCHANNYYENGNVLLNGCHISYDPKYPLARNTKCGIRSINWTCEGNCSGWDCSTNSYSWYCRVGSGYWKCGPGSYGFVNCSDGWTSKSITYNIHTGNMDNTFIDTNGLCIFLGGNSRNNCKLLEVNSRWSSTAKLINFPADNYLCYKNSNNELVYKNMLE